MVVPHNGQTRVYSRITDGKRGPQNKWVLSDVETIMAQLEGETVVLEPVGVPVTLADAEAIEANGYSAVLGTKAQIAQVKAAAASQTDAVIRFCEIFALVDDESSDLESLVIDRRRTGIEAAPAKQEDSVFVIETVEDEPEPQVAVDNSSAPVLNVSLASVPPRHLAERYVHRNIHGKYDFDVYDLARAEKVNVLIYGPTGPGKTTSIEAWCAARDLRLAQVSGNATLEVSHLFGKYVPDGKGGFVWVNGPITDVVRNGGVINLDEINFISPKIYTVLYPLLTNQRFITLLDHHGEVIEAHDDLTIFATMNPDYIGTVPLNWALRNRFDIQIPWDYDNDVESKLVSAKNLLVLARLLRDEAAKGQYETPISTNMLIEFSKFVERMGYEFAVENFIAHFSTDEQASVRLVFQAHEYNIKSDFGLDMVVETDAGDETPVSDNTDNVTVSI